MTDLQSPDISRKRAPSKRALATRGKILDASEQCFARAGYDGTSLRDIATAAGVQVGLVHHHGQSKETLFAQTVARRADELAGLRRDALRCAKDNTALDLEDILRAFFGPYLELAQSQAHWFDYARLVAHVSVDPRWRTLCADCFDPTADIFLNEINDLLPQTPRAVLASGFVYSVSAMLAHLTTQWRIETLGGSAAPPQDHLSHLVQFCAAGITATATSPPPS